MGGVLQLINSIRRSIGESIASLRNLRALEVCIDHIDNEDTETLANIFAIQGNFPKAIIAYEQLMLTNPEKKIFFAQRIKELKEKLNT